MLPGVWGSLGAGGGSKQFVPQPDVSREKGVIAGTIDFRKRDGT